MLVTVSGPVGGGKSTLATQILAAAQARGQRSELWKFRTLPCFRFLGRSRGNGGPSAGSASTGQERWGDYERRPLDARTTLVQLARILAFQVYRYGCRHDGVIVCNRYFYDSFVHFDVTTRRARLLVEVLRRCVPEPDLAFRVVSSPETVASRRPTYAARYVTATCQAYARLQQWFPALIEISGENAVEAGQMVEAALDRALAPPGAAARRSGAGADASRHKEKA